MARLALEPETAPVGGKWNGRPREGQTGQAAGQPGCGLLGKLKGGVSQ